MGASNIKNYLEEVNLVKQYRNEHLSIREISKILNKSKGWVSDRLRKTESKTKESIKNELLIPYVLNKKHEIQINYFAKVNHMWSIPSLVTKVNDKTYIFEIIPIIKSSKEIKRALGTIFFDIIALGIDNYKYVLVIPKEYKHYEYFSSDFIDRLKNHHILILFL